MIAVLAGTRAVAPPVLLISYLMRVSTPAAVANTADDGLIEILRRSGTLSISNAGR